MKSVMRRRCIVVCMLVAACGDDIPDAAITGDTGLPPGAMGSSSGNASTTGEVASEDGLGTSTGDEVVTFTGSLRVMTFNVLCSLCDPTYDPWDERVPWIGDTIVRHDPDLVGLQEPVFPEEVDEILAVTPGYVPIYFDTPGQEYPDSTILYRESMFEPIEHGFYWLSPTPDVPHSRGFAEGFQLARLVTWTVLRRLEDDAQLYFAATHFDNNAPSQELSAPLVLERVAPFVETLPVVMVGDFNSRPDSVAYATLTGEAGFVDTFDIADVWRVEYNATRRPDYDTTIRIDHVFVAGADWTVPEWVVDLWRYGDNTLAVSDHWAITADLSL